MFIFRETEKTDEVFCSHWTSRNKIRKMEIWNRALLSIFHYHIYNFPCSMSSNRKMVLMTGEPAVSSLYTNMSVALFKIKSPNASGWPHSSNYRCCFVIISDIIIIIIYIW